MSGAEPFLLHGGRRGVLLVHGFTGSPSEMRLLGEHLHQEGYTVYGPRLCGHGCRVDEMAGTNWPHWYSAVEDGYHILNGLCDEVNVAGLSMGGLLTLKLATEYPLARVVSLSTPIYLTERRLPLLPIYRLFRNYVPKRRRRMPVDETYNVCYDRTPLSSLASLLDLIHHVDGLLGAVAAPALVIQSRAEHTVVPDSAQHIYDRIASQEKRLVWLEKSGHIITLDSERNRVFREITEFLAGGGTSDGR